MECHGDTLDIISPPFDLILPLNGSEVHTMNELIKHINFNGDNLLAVQDESGNVLISVNHICNGLGLDAPTQKLKLREHATLSKGVGICRLPSDGGIQDTFVINLEFLPLWLAGINPAKVNPESQEKLVSYQLKAKDVLSRAFIQNNIPRSFAEALRLAADEYEARIAAESKLQIAAPKADSYDQFLSGDNFQDMNTVAKVLHQGRNKLFALLRGKKILRSDNTPYQEYCDRGYFEVKQKTITMGDITFNKPQTYVTPRGFDYISKLVEKAECLAVMQ
jgi:phage antirepressor YoqD-like protein